MKLATIRVDGGSRAVRIDGNVATAMDYDDVGALLQVKNWRTVAEEADGERHDAAKLDYAPVVPRPSKIICVGLNYRTHILETGSPIPEYPTLFAKFAPSLIGAYDDIELSQAASNWDWETELALVVSETVYRADEDRAGQAIAGYTVANDISARDWQMRTPQWLQGKTFANTTPVGPWLVTADEAPLTGEISCKVNGEYMQKGNVSDLVFTPAKIVSYISTFMPLAPGDLVLTGTPGGVGMALDPPRFLTQGDAVVTAIEGIGECRNTCTFS